ncbi:MAG: amidase [Actinomycetota bacterium]|nr:amidase [Actinomycetota bacterium]
MRAQSTFITRCDPAGSSGVRLAVKDIIDVAGIPTTAGSRAVANRAAPAEHDAACLARARDVGARIVGKTNLHELALGVSGVNPFFGTPVNPLDPARVPGGSSSGSAVAVATGEADVAYGTDTGGSVRIPAACCGVAGLKTTWGRIDVEGVWPLAPSFDTVGPLARDVAGLVAGMAMLESGFSLEGAPGQDLSDLRIARLHVGADPAIDRALDHALEATGWDIRELDTSAWLPAWDSATADAGVLLVYEAWGADRALAEEHPDEIGADVLARLHLGRDLEADALSRAIRRKEEWTRHLESLFREVDLLVTPTITIFPPALEDGDDLLLARCTLPVNLAGVPALALPIPSSGPLPASIQLVGPAMSEAMLLGAGFAIEAALR